MSLLEKQIRMGSLDCTWAEPENEVPQYEAAWNAWGAEPEVESSPTLPSTSSASGHGAVPPQPKVPQPPSYPPPWANAPLPAAPRLGVPVGGLSSKAASILAKAGGVEGTAVVAKAAPVVLEGRAEVAEATPADPADTEVEKAAAAALEETAKEDQQEKDKLVLCQNNIESIFHVRVFHVKKNQMQHHSTSTPGSLQEAEAIEEMNDAALSLLLQLHHDQGQETELVEVKQEEEMKVNDEMKDNTKDEQEDTEETSQHSGQAEPSEADLPKPELPEPEEQPEKVGSPSAGVEQESEKEPSRHRPKKRKARRKRSKDRFTSSSRRSHSRSRRSKREHRRRRSSSTFSEDSRTIKRRGLGKNSATVKHSRYIRFNHFFDIIYTINVFSIMIAP